MTKELDDCFWIKYVTLSRRLQELLHWRKCWRFFGGCQATVKRKANEPQSYPHWRGSELVQHNRCLWRKHMKLRTGFICFQSCEETRIRPSLGRRKRILLLLDALYWSRTSVRRKGFYIFNTTLNVLLERAQLSRLRKPRHRTAALKL